MATCAAGSRCCILQPPQAPACRPKCGQRGRTRWLLALCSSVSVAASQLFLRRWTLTLTSSPGSAPSTNTTLPSGRCATPCASMSSDSMRSQPSGRSVAAGAAASDSGFMVKMAYSPVMAGAGSYQISSYRSGQSIWKARSGPPSGLSRNHASRQMAAEQAKPATAGGRACTGHWRCPLKGVAELNEARAAWGPSAPEGSATDPPACRSGGSRNAASRDRHRCCPSRRSSGPSSRSGLP